MSALTLPGIVLGPAAAAAAYLALARWSPPARDGDRRASGRILLVAIACQGLHFVEETATGFPERVGEVLGVPGIPFGFFVAFNVAWLVVWIVSVPAVRSGRALGFFAAWFLAVAGMINGVAHPALAVVERGYFPGLASAPVVGGVCVLLWRALRRATVPRA